MTAALADLPLYAHRAAFAADSGNPLLVEAEPGAGKSTLIPLWALDACPVEQQVWLIQPRILATRAVARRLASLHPQPQTVGYQVPYERTVNEQTRLRVMTPGIFLQQLLHDPALSQVHTVILDEVHERSMQQDIAWAWLQELLVLRDDLRVILMTATPDPALRQQVTHRLHAVGRQFPVHTQWLPPNPNERLSSQVVRALHQAKPDTDATILVFLPGWHDIEACHKTITQQFPTRQVVRLHSVVSSAEQQQAIDPASGPRIILSTNIAETSLTVPDVTWVIDSGQARFQQFEQSTGVSRLVTRQISQASADQRRGRAGRVQSGHCIRLWSESLSLAPAERPDILHSDAIPLALLLAHWGTDAALLNWPDRPSAMALQLAQKRLHSWGHVDERGKITALGKQVSALGTHPRIAAWLQQYRRIIPADALTLALALHFTPETGDDPAAWRAQADQQAQHHPHWQQQAKRWLKVLSLTVDRQAPWQPEHIAAVMRDRIGVQKSSGLYRLESGISVQGSQTTMGSDWALFLSVQRRGEQHLGYAVPLSPSRQQQRAWSSPQHQLARTRHGWMQETQWLLGGRVVDTERHPVPDTELPNALLSVIALNPLTPESWDSKAKTLLARARLAASKAILALPPVDNESLHQRLADWLLPFLNADTQLDKLPWYEGLKFYLGQDGVHQLRRLLPDEVTLPSGRQAKVDYNGEQPMVAGKLQEFFGAKTMTLADGRLPLTLHLLSPAGRPLAITADLGSFWANSYPSVRKEMRGRYPRHPWPVHPDQHIATHKTKRALLPD
ncbi:ATP-dependent helicase HrpB [Salinispirillum sp. LH 10-3-1]|uniref:ATP-dependent helicase HrpB n=1 Tax=Salinispirillum sp. LH 10-3-1 TaxID=2952525 RepID=A0AB38YD70_9GAMM